MTAGMMHAPSNLPHFERDPIADFFIATYSKMTDYQGCDLDY